jgi:Nif-specific regulatory protein
VGDSPAMRDIYEQIDQVMRSTATVLLRGETGTGKELVARAIHNSSLRASGPMVTVNCAAFPETLLESELYGYERGAFTGAERRRKGRIEAAHGGTLFLDEIGELSLSGQVRLLRVLQERTFERLGSEATVKVDIRVIAATHQDLETAIREKRFREDLYYRINVFPLFIPALRDRSPDVPLLANHFVLRYAAEYGKRVSGVSAEALRMLAAHSWPGNVREFQNVIERGVLVCKGGLIEPCDLPPPLRSTAAASTGRASSLSAVSQATEEKLLVEALRTARGSKAKSARLLGSTERVVRYKIRKYGIDCGRFRE